MLGVKWVVTNCSREEMLEMMVQTCDEGKEGLELRWRKDWLFHLGYQQGSQDLVLFFLFWGWELNPGPSRQEASVLPLSPLG